MQWDVIENFESFESWEWGYVTEKDETNQTLKVKTGTQTVQTLSANQIYFKIGWFHIPLLRTGFTVFDGKSRKHQKFHACLSHINCSVLYVKLCLAICTHT